MLEDFALIRFPELVIGIAGPIGVAMETICEATQDALRSVKYGSTVVKLTDEIEGLPSSFKKPRGKNFHGLMKFKMDHASDLCRSRDDPAFLMRIVIAAIRRERERLAEDGKSLRA